MTDDKLPRLKFIQLSSYIADLMLASEGDYEALKVKSVRRTWHILYFSLIIFLVCTITAQNWFDMSNSIWKALCWRSLQLGVWSYILLLTCILAYQHYCFLLKTGKDLRFKNILFFFLMGMLVFSYIYFWLFFVNPGLFLYASAPVKPANMLLPLTMKHRLILFLDFTTYSGCTFFTLDYPCVRSNSTLVSAVNFVQVLYGIALVSFFVATFIQKTDSRKAHENAEQGNPPGARKDAPR